MNKDKIVTLLKDENPQDVEKFATYIIGLKLATDRKTGKLKNPWIQSKTEVWIVDKFKRVKQDNLLLDGVHVSIGARGLSYDYIAYKNIMTRKYPETLMDIQLVCKGDEFKSWKESGKVFYTHNMSNPFDRTEATIEGGYAIIKNRRGEFITLLSKADFQKHRAIATTDNIWKNWYNEMCDKTLCRKACKFHFSDMYEGIDEEDNVNYNLQNPLDLEIEFKSKIDEITTIEDLSKYYNETKPKVKNMAAFNKYVTMKKAELSKEKAA